MAKEKKEHLISEYFSIFIYSKTFSKLKNNNYKKVF